MREKKDKFFLRQHVKLMPRPTPSGRDDVIRLKFLEIPYRIYYKIPKGYKTAFFSILWTAIVPFIIYQCVTRIVKFQNKAKLRATLQDDELEVLDMLEKMKIR